MSILGLDASLLNSFFAGGPNVSPGFQRRVEKMRKKIEDVQEKVAERLADFKERYTEFENHINKGRQISDTHTVVTREYMDIHRALMADIKDSRRVVREQIKHKRERLDARHHAEVDHLSKWTPVGLVKRGWYGVAHMARLGAHKMGTLAPIVAVRMHVHERSKYKALEILGKEYKDGSDILTAARRNQNWAAIKAIFTPK
jgi:hypothetical protein